MRRQLVLGILLVAAASGQLAAYDLSQHQWRHRLLLLIAPRANDPDFAAKVREITLRPDALLDRDTRVFQLLPNQGYVGDTALSPEDVQRLRDRLGVTVEDRLVILIGKDGGIKTQSALNIDLREIFLQIDAMPMRRDEMSAKQEAGIPVTPP